MSIDTSIVKPVPEGRTTSHFFSFKTLKTSPPRSRDRMFFTEQLALLIETGISVHDSLMMLKDEMDNPKFQSILDTMTKDVSEGKPLSQALAKHPTVFSKTYTNLIAASEGGGFLHPVLLELLAMDQKRETLKNILVSAFTYPIFLLIFSIAVVLFILVFVFPKFGELFAPIRDQLPPTTLALLWISDHLISFWPVVLGGVVIGFFLIRYWLKSPRGKAIGDHLKLSIPFVKAIAIELYLVLSLRVVSLSLSRGVSILDTLAACKETVQNYVFQQFLEKVQKNVEEGQKISQEFKKSPLIPPLVQQMIATGEASGALPKVMSRIADFYEQRLTQRLHFISKIAEPVMLVVMGALVGLIVSSLILPIFMLSKSVH